MWSFETIGVARGCDKQELEDLQRRASLVADDYREQLLANPEVIEVPLRQLDLGYVLAASRGGRFTGFAAIELNADGSAELDGLFVEPARWRQGVATRLIASIEQLARDLGSDVLHVTANPNALGFYTQVGFVKVGSTATLFGPADRMLKAIE
jgi:GNAT superfamily N-acetyltransferase